MKRFVFLLTLVFIAVLFVSCKTYDEPVNKNREVISVVFQERDGDTDIYVITYDDGSTSILEVPNDGNDTSQDMLDCDHKYGKYTYMHINGNDDETPCEDRYYYSICVKCNLLDWRKGNYGDHSFITETTLPTCIASGFDTDVCSFCGKVEIKNFTEKTEHKISTTYLTDATNHWYQCMICDQKIASESHVRSEAFVRNSIESTCYSEGSYEAEVCCEVCNVSMHSTTIVVPKKEHDHKDLRYEDEFCDDKQLVSVFCSVCGEYVKTYGHDYVKSIENPSCVENGKVVYTCTYCNDSYYTELPALGHYAISYQVLLDADCDNDGVAVKVCEICDDVIDEMRIAKLGHKYTSTSSGNTVFFECFNCGDSYLETVDTPIHKVKFVSDETVIYESNVVDGEALGYLPTPHKDGYDFYFWSTSKDGENEYLHSAIHNSMTLYAVWEEIIEIDTSYSDLAVFGSVETDFAFVVLADSLSSVNKNLKIYNTSKEQISYDVTYLGDGRYEIGSDNYVGGNHYYALLDKECSFEGTSSRELQFSTVGPNRSNVLVANYVKWLCVRDVQAIASLDDGFCLITDIPFEVDDNVIIYGENESDIKLAINITSIIDLNSRKGYIFEVADYEKVFEELDIYFTGDLSNAELEILPGALEEIQTVFLNSSMYAAMRASAQQLARDFDIEFEMYGFKANVFVEDGELKFLMEFEIDFNGKFTIVPTVSIVTYIDLDCSLEGLAEYSAIVKTAVNYNINFAIKKGADNSDEFLHPKEYDDYIEMYKNYYELFEPAQKFEKPEATSNGIKLCKINIPIFLGATVSIEPRINLDFEFSGSLGISSSFVSYQEVGVRDGVLCTSNNFKLAGVYGYAMAKIEAELKLELEVFINWGGIGIYGTIGIGPKFELALAGCIKFGDNIWNASRGGYYINLTVNLTCTIGIKIEALDVKIFDLNFSFDLWSWTVPGFPIGNEKICTGFVDPSQEVEVDVLCNKENEFDLDKIVNKLLIYNNVQDMTVSSENAEKVHYSIVSTSGYASKIKLKGSVLSFDAIAGDVNVNIRVIYNDVFSKELVFTYTVTHAEGCDHLVCSNGYHTGGSATCTDKAICELCGLEYGDTPSGHVFDNNKCKFCGLLLESVGLKYKILNDGTYAVVDIGSCTDTYLVIPETYNDIPVTAIDNYNYSKASLGNVTNIYISKNVTSVKIYSAEKLEGVVFNKDNQVKEIYFNNCAKLISLAVPDNVTTLSVYGCNSLNSVSFGTSTKIGWIYISSCPKLRSIYVPSTVETFTAHGAGIETVSFAEQSKLTRIEMSGCTTLTSLALPEGLVSIGAEAFSDCTSLKTLTVSSTVETIGLFAFYGCSSLESITFVANSKINTVYTQSFQNCVSLKNVYFDRTKEEWKSIAKVNWCYGVPEVIIHCSDGGLIYS